MQKCVKYGLFVLLTVALTGCAWVDEDMRNCESDYNLDYEMRLVTNLTTELKTQVSTQVELTAVATVLQEHLGTVFTDFAHDVNLSFYDVEGDSVRLHHEAHIMDASQHNYTLFIPRHRYMHLAVANLEKCGQLRLLNDEKCHTAVLQQEIRDTVSSFKAGVFTGRLAMDIEDGVDQQFDVKLSMTSCASALALDTLGSGIKELKVYMSGFANGFNLADSSYLFQFTPQVIADKVKVTDDRFACFCAVTFPSRDVETKMIIDSDDPYVSPEAEEALWNCTVYATTKEGTTTKTVMGVNLPLRPGQFKLIRAHVEPDGSVAPREQFVGASVTLNWNEQPGIDIDL